MIANTLSNKDRAKVASEVTGLAYKVEAGRIFCWSIDNEPFAAEWEPGFTSAPLFRSQALALVEYLADSGDSNYQFGAIRCVQRRDVESLMQLAHQMITKGKEDAS